MKKNWKSLPLIYREGKFVTEPYWDVEGAENAEMGQSFMEPRRNIRGYITGDEGREPTEATIRKGLLVGHIGQLPRLHLMPNGSFETGCRKPQVWDSQLKRWVWASPHKCRNWEKLPENSKRIVWYDFIIPD